MKNPEELGYYPLPSIVVDGESIQPKNHVEKNTFLYLMAASLIAIVAGIFLFAVTYGIFLLVFLIGLLVAYFHRKKSIALVKGSALRVGPNQFSSIHDAATVICRRLGMKEIPDIYILENNVINASAQRIAGRQIVILIDDIVDACLRSGDPKTLGFILAHEIAHHALGHTGFFRSTVTQYFKPLSRKDEFSCDALAHALMGDSEVSIRALSLLLVGPNIFPYLNLHEMKNQAREVEKDKHSLKAEGPLTHPLLLRRVARFV